MRRDKSMEQLRDIVWGTNYYNEHLSTVVTESFSTGFPLYGFFKDQVLDCNIGIVQYLQ